MKLKGLLLISAVSFGVIACSGGGGGGGGVDGTDTNTNVNTPVYTPTANIPLLATATASKPHGSNSSWVSFPNGSGSTRNDIPGAEGTVFQLTDYLTLPDGRLAQFWQSGTRKIATIDGVPSSESASVAWDTRTFTKTNAGLDLAVGGFSYLGKGNEPYSFYAIQDSGLKNHPISNRNETSWSWDGINYGYTAIKASTKESSTSTGLDNGKITVNNGNWNATLGNVTLSGKIAGNAVTGTATGKFFGQTLSGQFAGIDGLIGQVDQKTVPGTVGGFAGGNSNATFAGGWMGLEK